MTSELKSRPFKTNSDAVLVPVARWYAMKDQPDRPKEREGCADQHPEGLRAKPNDGDDRCQQPDASEWNAQPEHKVEVEWHRSPRRNQRDVRNKKRKDEYGAIDRLLV